VIDDGQRAAGEQVGDQHALVGAEHLAGLGHEVDARLHDHVRVGLGRLSRQPKAVAHVVADAVEDLRRHVVVGQDHRVSLALERVDAVDQGRVEPPLVRGHAGADLLPDRGEVALDFGRERESGVGHLLLLCSL
jgi:hypothetical protein